MHICMECFETYNGMALNRRDYEIYDECKCPKLNCGGTVVEIDELIAPTIIILNQKGYMTEFCCSGHWYKTSFKPYIKFVDKENTPKVLPAGWEYEDQIVIRFKAKKFASLLEQYRLVMDLNVQLLEWANGLPHNDF